jgi:L-ascorbate metabolism protein UlaG (beta-lactamase superfamily)
MRKLLVLLVLLLPLRGLACGVIAQAPGPRVMRAATGDEGVEITFLGHASFLIRSPGGVTAVTDYNGSNIPNFPPDIATMNIAHSTHWTPNPDPRIAHVLHGWRDDGKAPEIDLKLGDMRVRNLPTNIREWGGSGTREYGNSIFVFETNGLCIAHLGHLHHLLTPDDLAVLGQIDVVMAPVDGYWTLSHEDIAIVLGQLHPRLVLAMHYFGEDILRKFARVVAESFPVRMNPSASITLSLGNLPEKPETLVLTGPYY